MAKRILIVLKSSPQEAGFYEALRITLSFVGMDLLPSVVFVDDAVLALSPKASFLHGRVREYLESVIEMTNASVLLESLSHRGLSYESLQQLRGIQGIGSGDLAALTAEADTVFAL